MSSLSGFSSRLQQAIVVEMVRIDVLGKRAIILAPPGPESLDDKDWLYVLKAASEVGFELESLGYTVTY